MGPAGYHQAIEYAERLLRTGLPNGLAYHGLSHTRDEVVPAVKRFAMLEGVPPEVFNLLITAAWFHDIGFVRQITQHEWVSAEIAGEELPAFGFTTDQIEIIQGAIMATALPQSPTNLFEQILTDADLDVLGREEFPARNQDLRKEFDYLGRVFSDYEWYSAQLAFLESHQYFTRSARAFRNAQKEKNVQMLRLTLAEL
jgi:uncharacterized protein